MPGAGTLSLRDLNRATLARQLLLERAPVGVAEAVERLGGLQAQEPRPPFLALWSRIAGFAAADLAAALRTREIVRATLLRATLHLWSARDYVALRGALQPAMDEAMRVLKGRDRGLDLDAVLPVARELFGAAPRTFNEARALLHERFPDVDDRALGYSVRLQLPLVMVPSDDRWAFPRDARFALAEDWLGTPPADGDAGARAALARRYLGAFGPAGAADVQTWSGVKGLRADVEALRDELAVLTGPDGRELVDLPGAPRPGGDAAAPARLLPEFDSLVLAHADRTRVVPEAYRDRIVTKNLRVRAVALVDGFACATWRLERKGRRASVAIEPFAPLPAGAAAALTDEAERLLAFAEPEATSTAVRVEGT